MIRVVPAVVFPDLNFGELRFWQWQRHTLAGLDHIQFAWQQHHEPGWMANATGNAAGVIAGTPVDVGARRPDDRRSRILRYHQPLEGRTTCALDRQIGFDEERGPVLMQRVHGDGPAWR